MAIEETTSTGHAPDTRPSALVLEQAANLFETIAQRAANNDLLCYHTHGELAGNVGIDQSEHFLLELDRMRDIINRMGWLADLGSEKLRCGVGPIRGDAERWLMSRRYVRLLDQAKAEAGNV